MKNPPNIDIVDLQAADVLNRAADVLEKEGWCTHDIGRAGRPKCAIGAMAWAMTGRTSNGLPFGPVSKRACGALIQEIGRNVDDWGQICVWNNRQRESRPVIDTMRKAAKSLTHDA